MLPDRLGQSKHRLEVDAHHRGEVVEVALSVGPAGCDAGIVDANVDVARDRERRLDQAGAVRGVGDVTAHGGDSWLGSGELGDPLDSPGARDHAGSGLREHGREARPKAARSPGHDRDPILEQIGRKSADHH